MDILTLKLSKNYTDKKAVGIVIKVVDALPATGANSTIYLVPNSGSGLNTHDEYIWVSDQNKFEKIGTTDIDLSGYAKKTDEVITNKELLSNKSQTIDTDTTKYPSNNAVKTYVDTQIGNITTQLSSIADESEAI